MYFAYTMGCYHVICPRKIYLTYSMHVILPKERISLLVNTESPRGFSFILYDLSYQTKHKKQIQNGKFQITGNMLFCVFEPNSSKAFNYRELDI